MVLVELSEEGFEYDIHSLVQAFYPGQTVVVTADQGKIAEKKRAAAQTGKAGGEEILFGLTIRYLCRQPDAGRDAGCTVRADDAGCAARVDDAGCAARVDDAGCVAGLADAGYAARVDDAGCAARVDDAGCVAGLADAGNAMRRDSAAADTLEIDGRLFAFHGGDRRQAKNDLKKALYRVLSERTGKTLPWGSLTGIRPAKIPMDFLGRGVPEADIRRYMKETYSASEEKISLCLEVAKKEKSILEGLDYQNGYSLYLGIPFCPTTCLYCSFPSFPAAAWAERMGEYIGCLEKEIDFTAAQMAGRKPNTVYIGGGTPTTLPPELLLRLITKIATALDLSNVKEFTLEAGRPDSITGEKLAAIRKTPVTRISINPQTMNQKTLDLIGRRHTVEQVAESMYLAREAGFDNINMDLIAGLPEETYGDVKRTMAEIAKLSPESVTVHSLAVKRSARLNVRKEDYRHLHIVNTQEMIDLTARECRRMGLSPYYLYRQKNMAGNFENVGYARDGKEGLYNILMMEEVQTIVACGAGAISKRVYPGGNIKRCENVKDVAQYIGRIGEMIDRKRVLFGDST